MSSILDNIPLREYNPDKNWGAHLSSYVRKSLRRCSFRTYPQKPPIISPDELYEVFERNKTLIPIIDTVIAKLLDFIGNQDIAIIYVDLNGIIVTIKGDSSIIELLSSYNIIAGTDLSEQASGTNAFGVTLIEGVPIEVKGNEHYLHTLTSFHSIAAPIFDKSLIILGALGFITLNKNHYNHLVALATIAVDTILWRFRYTQEVIEESITNDILNQALSKFGVGFIIWDEQRKIKSLNRTTERMLGIQKERIQDNQIDNLIKIPEDIQKDFIVNNEINFRETDLLVNQRKTELLLSAFKFPEYQSNIALFNQVQKNHCNVKRFIVKNNYTFEDVIGISPQIEKLRSQLKMLIRAKACVLISGEEGTEKSLIANVIHSQSLYHDGPFVIFPCNSYPSDRMLTELFGCDNENDKCYGQFELADNGSIYFQEINLLPLEIQDILLNFLKSGIVKFPNNKYILNIDLRILSDTKYSLEELSLDKRIIPELLSWLKAFTIIIPPLRERKEDIPALAYKVLEHFSKTYGKNIELTSDATTVLLEYDWPGNHRELAHVLETASRYLSDKEHKINKSHLQLIGFIPLQNKPIQDNLDGRKFERIQYDILIQTLQECHGNLSQTARIMGVGRSTIWRWIKRMNIPIENFR